MLFVVKGQILENSLAIWSHCFCVQCYKDFLEEILENFPPPSSEATILGHFKGINDLLEHIFV